MDNEVACRICARIMAVPRGLDTSASMGFDHLDQVAIRIVEAPEAVDVLDHKH